MNPSYFATWWFCQAAFRVYFRWRAYGVNNVPRTGPCILASNHVSFADPLLVSAGPYRDFQFLARESLFRNPVVGAILRSWNVVPVDRDGGGAGGLKKVLDHLLSGGGIGLFPEGTRTPDGRLLPARSGIGLAVVKSDCPVVPVRIFGGYEAFGRHTKWPRPWKVVVKYGRPLDFVALRAEARTCSKPRLKAIYQEVADQLMAAIGKLEPCADVTRFPPA